MLAVANAGVSSPAIGMASVTQIAVSLKLPRRYCLRRARRAERDGETRHPTMREPHLNGSRQHRVETITRAVENPTSDRA